MCQIVNTVTFMTQVTPQGRNSLARMQHIRRTTPGRRLSATQQRCVMLRASIVRTQTHANSDRQPRQQTQSSVVTAAGASSGRHPASSGVIRAGRRRPPSGNRLPPRRAQLMKPRCKRRVDANLTSEDRRRRVAHKGGGRSGNSCAWGGRRGRETVAHGSPRRP